MKRIYFHLLFLLCGVSVSAQSSLPKSTDIMETAALVANYFMDKYPDVGANSYVGGKERNSKIWTRSVFYEGLLNIYREEPEPAWLKYALDWGEFHKWVSSSDTEAAANNADYQCCGQAYLQLYLMDPEQTVRMQHIKMRIDQTIETGRVNFWTWVDAIQMAMPVFALLGEITGDDIYHQRMWELYEYTRNSQGGSKKGGGQPLFNEETGLWYRDANFDPPYRDLVETNKDCYWSRGNGWVYMALARVLQFISPEAKHRNDYINDFLRMSEGLKACQKPDGSWGVSLLAPSNFGAAGSVGIEMTGTSLFVGGMAWGVKEGLLDADTYLPVIEKGWESMLNAVHPDSGQVGYLQGTGSKPEDGGPITYDSIPDFEDFGYGCWLWGAGEVHGLAASLEANSQPDPDDPSDPDNPDNPDDPEASINSIGASDSMGNAIYYDLNGRRVYHPIKGTLYIRDHKLIRY